MIHPRAMLIVGVPGATILPAAADDISGAGATLHYPIYAKWADTYKKGTGIGLNCQSIGSGGGIKQIVAKTVTFGATDATFILIPKQRPDPASAAEALKFFAWAYANGDKMAEELDYVPMSEKVVAEIEENVGQRNQASSMAH